MAGVKGMDRIQNKALHMALAGHNVLVTGFPGTGKSFVISEIAQNLKLSGKVVAVTATTGKAAQVLQGKIPPASKLQVSTVHKFLGLKDGRYSNEELVSLLQSEESFSTKNKNIKTIDCLIIDEISMLSTKLFEQIECVLSEIRQTPTFGGIQLILSGIFQLPPVANPSYGDNGSYCFLSRFIRCLHHVQLTEMHRQSEPDLIAAIHQSARGQITEDTFNLIKRLKRTLPPGPKPLKLFAMNIDVEIYNSECLLEMEGDMRVFEAEDDGDLGKLASVSVPKQVAVKVGCPVILTVNLSDELVNGLAGEVRAITHDTVDVYFESLKRRVTLKPFSFTVYDANKKIDVACRTQFPIRLAFALTVHKAQGLTVDRISIDCTQMYQFGQIAVAISRCTTKKGLHITNFSKRLLRNPPGIILEFYGKEQYLPKVDWSCCKKHVPEVLETCSQEYEELFTPFEDITETLSDDDTEAMIGLVDLMEDESEETTVEYKLPDTFSVSAILENIKSIGETEQQIQENQVITVMKNSENTQKLVKYLWNSFYSLKEKFFKNKEDSVTENKTVSDFYKAVHVIMSGDKLKKLSTVFGSDPVARKNVVFKLASAIRNCVLESTAAPLREKAVETAQTERGQEFPESDGGRGKSDILGVVYFTN